MKNEKIISVLVGLVGAINNNGKKDQTDKIILDAVCMINSKEADAKVNEMVELLTKEKYLISPDCAICKAPCGNTSDYNLEEYHTADVQIRKIKEDIIDRLVILGNILKNENSELPVIVLKSIAYFGYNLQLDSYNKLILELEKEIRCRQDRR